jgi:hypothetical protein
MAASLVTHMGLHAGALEYLNSESRSVPTVTHGKERLQTFWQFFLVDRYVNKNYMTSTILYLVRMATSMLGRQCTIPWKRVMTSPFESILDTNSTFDKIAFDHQCKLWMLHDQFMDQM